MLRLNSEKQNLLSQKDLNPLDYGVWAQMKKYIFDRGARTQETVVAAVDSFFNTHQDMIKDCILGAKRLVNSL